MLTKRSRNKRDCEVCTSRVKIARIVAAVQYFLCSFWRNREQEQYNHPCGARTKEVKFVISFTNRIYYANECLELTIDGGIIKRMSSFVF